MGLGEFIIFSIILLLIERYFLKKYRFVIVQNRSRVIFIFILLFLQGSIYLGISKGEYFLFDLPFLEKSDDIEFFALIFTFLTIFLVSIL